MFQIFKEIDVGKTLLGNNETCKIEGIGYMKMRIFYSCDRVLENVRCILNLERNLISLGILDLIGCSIKVDWGVMKMMKCALTI